MITLPESANNAQENLNDRTDKKAELEAWENIDVAKILRDEITKGRYFEPEYYQNTKNIKKRYGNIYNLVLYRALNVIEEFKAESEKIEEFMENIFKDEKEYIKYQQDYLLRYAQSLLENSQNELFNDHIDEIVTQWILKTEESNFKKREVFLIREIKLFNDLLAGKTTRSQEKLLEVYYEIKTWEDIHFEYDTYLRSDSYTNSIDFYQSEGNVLAQAIQKYIKCLEKLLIKYKSGDSVLVTSSQNLNNSLCKFSSISQNQTNKETHEHSSSKEGKIDKHSCLRWNQASPFAEERLHYLYTDLIKDTNTTGPYIECTYKEFKEVLQGDIKARIYWVGCQSHLMYLIRLLRRNELIITPKHYLKATDKAFCLEKGSSKKTIYKYSNYEANQANKGANNHYNRLENIVMNLMRIK